MLDFVSSNEIWTTQELQLIDPDLNYKIMADIDLSGTDWIPIGTVEKPFTGIINGNGYTIKNLKCKQGDQNYAGLFGYSSGIIRNVRLEGVSVIGKDYTGGIAGYSEGILSGVKVEGIERISGGSIQEA